VNGNPDSAQREFHKELRELHGAGELHHIFGSKRKIYNYRKSGEWLVMMLSAEHHRNISKLSFEEERFLFLSKIAEYEQHYQKPCPIPEGLIKAYKSMTHKQQVMKGFSPYGDDVSGVKYLNKKWRKITKSVK
jgi:hypothetical protein